MNLFWTSATATKIPQITFAFWIMKIYAIILGEMVGDVLSISLSIGYIVSSLILSSTVATSLVLQLISKRCHPVFVWAVVFSTSTAATMLTDLFNSTFGIKEPDAPAALQPQT